MSGSRRGLVAPQNTLLDTIIRRCNSQHSSFILANAKIVDHPIVYVNEAFSKLTGYARNEVMQKSSQCTFLHGEETNQDSLDQWSNALNNYEQIQIELLVFKKDLSPLWIVLQIHPITNEKLDVLLLLLTFYDITPIKHPSDEEAEYKPGLSKFAKLAKSVARNRSVMIDLTQDFTENNKESSKTETSPTNNIFMHSKNIPQYKQETPKTPPHIILHYSQFKVIWDWIILLLTYYTAVMVPFNAAFSNKSMDAVIFLIVDSIVDVIFFLDIVLNFHTTFVGSTGEVISDAFIIRINYLKGWFIIDLMSCLPYDVFNAFQPGTQEGISQLLGALKVVRLLRLGRVLRKLDQYLEYMATMLVLMIFVFLLLAHWFACIWYTVGNADLRNNKQYGWIPKMLQDCHQTVANWTTFDPNKEHKLLNYATSLYFTMSLLTSIGFGNVSANTELEKFACVIFMLFGALIYATVFGNVTTILHQMYSSKARYQEMMNNIKEFIRIHDVPQELGERVLDYVTSSWAITKGIDTEKVLNYCPKDMKADLSVHLNRMVFNSHPAFRLASDGCLRALAVNFTTMHTAPGDLIFHQGESIDQLCFVVSGSLEVIQDEEVVAIMGKGDVFGDNVWVEKNLGQSASTVRVLTYCNLHCIKREKLLFVLNFYSSFANSFSRNLVLTVNLRNRFVFRKINDINREKELQERRKDDLNLSKFSNEHPVRKLISKFRKRSDPKFLREQQSVISMDHLTVSKVSSNLQQSTIEEIINDESDASDNNHSGNLYVSECQVSNRNASSNQRYKIDCQNSNTCQNCVEEIICQVKNHFGKELDNVNNHLNNIDSKLNTLINLLSNNQETEHESSSNYSINKSSYFDDVYRPSSENRIYKSFFSTKKSRMTVAPIDIVEETKDLRNDDSRKSEKD